MSIRPEVFAAIGSMMMRRQSAIAEATEERRFYAIFGTSTMICSLLWKMIDPKSIMPKGVSPHHLLWALMFMKIYSSEHVHCAMADGVDEKTFWKWAWIFVLAIADLEYHVVRNDILF